MYAIRSYYDLRSLIKARESVLMEDLYQLRRATDAYYADNAKYPDSLDDLVNKRYLRGIPRDPFTRESVITSYSIHYTKLYVWRYGAKGAAPCN